MYKEILQPGRLYVLRLNPVNNGHTLSVEERVPLGPYPGNRDLVDWVKEHGKAGETYVLARIKSDRVQGIASVTAEVVREKEDAIPSDS